MKMEEEMFFRETEPWRSLHLRNGGEAGEEVLKRCGVGNLVEFLSKLLIELIEARYAYFPVVRTLLLLKLISFYFVLAASQGSAK